jgi:hypothetical protein
MTVLYTDYLNQGRTQGGGRAGLQAPKPQKPKFKEHSFFFSHDDIKPFKCFTLQSKSSTEIS